MKKYLFLVFTLVFLFCLLCIDNNSTYAFISCENYTINPEEVSTNNMEAYLNNLNYFEIKSFCSYDMCYDVREKNISKSIENFIKVSNKKLNEEDRLIVDIKGYPITKIVVNNC